ncbi:hypothetical protein AAF712_003168 [Marasmius tenuissimus]|uniref:Rhamnogalacturonase B N-terminal domain-containing protein n=1 Tax=Marasmius tenuissimus TaxID=585030 RepID=A0ABR3A882_9AGAR
MMVPFIRDQVHGATGSGVGAFVIVPGVGYETSSGGPFFRGEYRIIEAIQRTPVKVFFDPTDIDNQGSAQQEVYFYMNSNHEQTESYRTGFFGP